MVSLGDNLIGSQFFFTLGSDLTSLDGIHCVIGEVTEGVEVLRKINEAICDNTNRPYQDIRITHTVVLEDPFDNPRGFREPSRSPSPSAERLKGGRIAADEEIDDAAGKTEQELQEMMEEREAKARATILEIVGDLPDAEMAPPENVLFVCKLNAVTTDDDLEIIFSRFGRVKSCEVIRDRVSGDSLQYAFVEFEDRKACEAAYFKMDNVLIDDRRIHVDFSQSVSKIQWRGKGRGLIVKDGSNNNRIDFSNYKENGEQNRSKRRSPPSRYREQNRRAEGNNRDKERRRYSPPPARQEHENRYRRNSPRPYQRYPRDNYRRSPNRGFNSRQSRSRSPHRNYRNDRNGSRTDRQRSRSRDNTYRRRSQPRNDDKNGPRYRENLRNRSRSRDDNRRRSRSIDNNKSRDDRRRSRSKGDDRNERRDDFKKVEKEQVSKVKNKSEKDRSSSVSSSGSSRKTKDKKSKKDKKVKKRKRDSSVSSSEKKHKKSKKKKDKKSKKSKKSKRKSSNSSSSSSTDSNSS